MSTQSVGYTLIAILAVILIFRSLRLNTHRSNKSGAAMKTLPEPPRRLYVSATDFHTLSLGIQSVDCEEVGVPDGKWELKHPNWDRDTVLRALQEPSRGYLLVSDSAGRYELDPAITGVWLRRYGADLIYVDHVNYEETSANWPVRVEINISEYAQPGPSTTRSFTTSLFPKKGLPQVIVIELNLPEVSNENTEAQLEELTTAAAGILLRSLVSRGLALANEPHALSALRATVFENLPVPSRAVCVASPLCRPALPLESVFVVSTSIPNPKSTDITLYYCRNCGKDCLYRHTWNAVSYASAMAGAGTPRAPKGHRLCSQCWIRSGDIPPAAVGRLSPSAVRSLAGGATAPTRRK